jgi:hypothetical protein
LNAATGRQLWSRTLIGNDHEGIDMAPGYNHGTVYVSTVPVDPTVGQYLGGGKGILWAIWADHLPSSPYGAATVTNNVVFTATYSGSKSQHALIIAYRLGAKGGKLPSTVGP